MDELSVTTLVAMAGFVVGVIFGATVNRTNFCSLGAISDMVLLGNLGRLRAWFLAIAVAIIGTQALHGAGIIDIYQGIYLRPNLSWLGNITGGLLFGFGMTLTSGCASKTVVRAGGGNLKSVVVLLILGVSAYMTMRGLFGVVLIAVVNPTDVDLGGLGLQSQGIADLLAAASGVEVGILRWVVTVAIAGGLLVFCLKDAEFRASPRYLGAGLIIGALISAGWWITGVLGHDDFEPTPLTSLTFVSPSGNAVQYLMTFSGATINFGIAMLGGAIVGSFLMAVATGSFRIEAFIDPADMIRHMVGAVFMGIGGVAAMGCTIGQGLSGMSTLAVGSVLALASIIVGGIYGLKYLEEGSLGGALKALVSRG